MTSDRWAVVKSIVAACLELPPGERTAYLAQVCGGEPWLLEECASLVRSHEQAGELLATPALAEPSWAGRRLGRFRILREIGEGGMARVYLADDPDDPARQVAVKLVKRGMDHDFVLRRFRQEQHIMRRLDHPNIARLLEGGTAADATPYFVMEYIRGLPIDRHADAGRLTIRQRLQLFLEVCSAVEYAHRRRIIHRDIKPANILMAEDGHPKLLDFGIAKILLPPDGAGTHDSTMTLWRLMTPEYASPEQVRGQPLTESTDIYSLGVLLYELLTGRKPYRLSRAPHEIARAICEQAPARPSTSVVREQPEAGATAAEIARCRGCDPDQLRRKLAGPLERIVLTALRKQPALRYASVAEMVEDVERFLAGRRIAARRGALAEGARRLAARHRARLIAAGFSLPLLALAAGVWRWSLADSAGILDAGMLPIRPFTTFPGNETQPVFSPDGSRIAFVWSGADGTNSDVYVKSLASGQVLRLTTDPAQDLSPAWSPDGRRIAFLRIKNSETAVFVSPAGGGVHGKIADVFPNREEAVGRHLDWSPDGRYLAVADKSAAAEPFSIFLVRAADGHKRKLTFPPEKSIGDSNPAFSPDGRYLTFLRAPGSGVTDLYRMPLAGGAARPLTSDRRVILAQCWLPDGRGLLFASNRSGGFTLWRMAAGGGTPRRIPGVGENVSEPMFSRDGRYLAYSQFFLDANIWALDLAGHAARGAPRPWIASTQYDSSPQFSPDGRRIAFRSNRSGNNEIWISDDRGANPRQVTHFNGPLTGTPRWSPDGRWIAFDSRPEGQADIYAIPAEGGAPRRITFETAEDVVPSWSRDGRWIYFASHRSGAWQVWKASFEGRQRIQVTRGGGFAALEAPDGRTLFYAKGRGEAGLFGVPVGGGAETPVLPNLKPGYWGYWAPAPEGIYFADTPVEGGQAGLYFYGFGDRRVTRVMEFDKSLALADSAFAISPDYHRILFTQIDQSGSDIMLAALR